MPSIDTTNWLGPVNNARKADGTRGDYSKQLFADIFRDNVMNQYSNACIIKDTHKILPGGKGSETQTVFLSSEAGAGIDIKTTGGGTGDILFGTINKNKVPINLDPDYDSNLALAHDELDQVVNDARERVDVARKVANAVAREWDFWLHVKLLQGALAKARVTRMDNGSMVDIKAASKAQVTAEELKEAVFALKAMYEDKNVVQYLNWLLMSPTDYSKLAQLSVLLDVDLGGSGSISKGNVKEIAGFLLKKSNVMPTANYTATTKIETLPFAYANDGREEELIGHLKNNYVVDGTDLIALSYDRNSVATVLWRPMTVKTPKHSDIDIIKKKWYISCFQRSGSEYMMEATCGGIRRIATD